MINSDEVNLKIALNDLKKQFHDPIEPVVALDKAILLHGLPLSKMADTFDTRSVIVLVQKMIQRFCMQFNVSKNMSDLQCMNLATEIVVEEGHKWRVEELVIFFERAAQGKYGKPIFDRIDRQVIEQMMDEYFATDRTNAKWRIEDEAKAADVPLPRTNTTPTHISSPLQREYIIITEKKEGGDK